MKNKFLITGATGFIGSNLVKRLVKKNIDIIAIDNNTRGNTERLKDVLKDIEFYQIDIRDYNKLLKISKHCKTLIHLAYINGTDNFYRQPANILDVAIRGMLNIFDVCKNNNIPELFVASSSEVFHKPDIIPTNEDVPLVIPDINNPRFSYGGGKILYELMGKHYGKEFLQRLVMFRPFNVYGLDMGMGHVIPQLIERATKSNIQDNQINFKIQGDGNQTRAFEYIDDFIDGLEIILEKGKDREIYNIGNDEEVTIKELVSKIFKIIKSEIKINIIPSELPQGGADRRCPDITKLKKIGYIPKVKLDQGLKKIIKI